MLAMTDGRQRRTGPDRPLDLSREHRTLDHSGTPAAFIEQLRRDGNLLILDEIDDSDVAIDFPMGAIWREDTGCERFVRLKDRREGKQYALVRGRGPGAR
jgi:hypothetical protein